MSRNRIDAASVCSDNLDAFSNEQFGGILAKANPLPVEVILIDESIHASPHKDNAAFWYLAVFCYPRVHIFGGDSIVWFLNCGEVHQHGSAGQFLFRDFRDGEPIGIHETRRVNVRGAVPGHIDAAFKIAVFFKRGLRIDFNRLDGQLARAVFVNDIREVDDFLEIEVHI